LYRGINDCGKGHKLRIYIVKNEKGDLVADIHSTLARWRNNFCQVLNAHGVKKVGRLKYSRDYLVSETSAFDLEMVTEKLKDTNHLGLIKFQHNSISKRYKISL